LSRKCKEKNLLYDEIFTCKYATSFQILGFPFCKEFFLISIENLNVKEVDLLVGEDVGYGYQGNHVKLMS
jgi:hypothetical protein